MSFEKGKIPEGAKPFQPGQSGNPGGRPKKIPEIDQLLADVLDEQINGQSVAKDIIDKLAKMAAGGNVRAAEVLLDRAYGKAKQVIDAKLEGGVQIVFEKAIKPDEEK